MNELIRSLEYAIDKAIETFDDDAPGPGLTEASALRLLRKARRDARAYLEKPSHALLTIKTAAAEYDIPYVTLYRAIRDGRVMGTRQDGSSTWHTTRAAIDLAIEAGRLRGKRNKQEGEIDDAD